MRTLKILFGLTFILMPNGILQAAGEDIISSEEHKFRIETLADGLDHPWAMVRLPDGRFLVTEKKGQLRIITNGVLQEKPVENVPEVYSRGQGGLMDIRLHPDYAQNGWIYLSYSKPFDGGKALTAVIRARLKENALTDIETIFDPPAEEATNTNIHFGDRIQFDGQGHVFFSIGERGDKDNAQKLDNVKGKIHRLMDDGKIPEDNPFVTTPGARPSIWSYGNRNPQGLYFDKATGLLWETEHGPKGGDELNIIRKGANYGWPLITYGIDYNGKPISDKTEMPGMEQPVIYWVPSIAACGLDQYRGDKFPKWKGNLFSGALAHQKIVRMVVDGEKVTHQEILLERTGRIRDVLCFDDGDLYVIYDDPGKIIRLVPAE